MIFRLRPIPNKDFCYLYHIMVSWYASESDFISIDRSILALMKVIVFHSIRRDRHLRANYIIHQWFDPKITTSRRNINPTCKVIFCKFEFCWDKILLISHPPTTMIFCSDTALSNWMSSQMFSLSSTIEWKNVSNSPSIALAKAYCGLSLNTKENQSKILESFLGQGRSSSVCDNQYHFWRAVLPDHFA